MVSALMLTAEEEHRLLDAGETEAIRDVIPLVDIDSLDILSMLVELEEEFSCDLDEDLFVGSEPSDSLSKLLDRIEAAIQNAPKRIAARRAVPR